MQPDIESDVKFADMPTIRQACAMSPATKSLAGAQLFEGVCKRMKEGLRDENPGCNDETIHGFLLEKLLALRKLEETDAFIHGTAKSLTLIPSV